MAHKFLDEILIRVRAGAGGSGGVSFRREKFIPRGGPDGGDGGKGGDVELQASSAVLSLSHLFPDKLYFAQDGENGQGRQKTGRSGKTLTIRVPLGTQVFNTISKSFVYDFVDESTYLLAKGGRGGKGNTFFKNSVRQAPDYAQEGESTEEDSFLLSLKLIADVGFVGLPNAGKSTLLKSCTNAKPKIANYAFTTLTPNLGYIDYNNIERVLVADIPGILEGASQGHGLGLSFLKHIERVRLILFVLDINTTFANNELELLRKELDAYSSKLKDKPYLIIMNKVDCIDDKEFLEEWVSKMEEDKDKVVLVSALNRYGIPQLKDKIKNLVIIKDIS